MHKFLAVTAMVGSLLSGCAAPAFAIPGMCPAIGNNSMYPGQWWTGCSDFGGYGGWTGQGGWGSNPFPSNPWQPGLNGGSTGGQR